MSFTWIEENLLNQNPCMASRLDVFLFGNLLSVALSESRSIFTSRPSLSPCNSFSVLSIHLAFLLCYFRFHILLQNYFDFFESGCFYFLIYFPIYLSVKFSFDILESPVLIVLFDSVAISSLLSPKPFDLSLQVALLDLPAVSLLFFHPNISWRAFPFHSNFACCRNFFTCVSTQISHAGSVFLFVFLKGKSILSQANFALA